MIFLVDADFFLSTDRTTGSFLFVDFYVFLETGSFARLARVSFVASVVTFPSNARGGKLDLLVYLDVCRLGDSITPVRGREDCRVLEDRSAALYK